MTEQIAALIDLTDKLPELSDIEFPVGGPVVTFNSRTGADSRGYGVGVYRDSDLGIMRGFMVRDSTLDWHQHSINYEWFGVVSGTVEVIFEDTDVPHRLEAHEAVRVGPGRVHYLRAVTNVVWWSVSMPPAAGYPTSEICPFAVKYAASAQ